MEHVAIADTPARRLCNCAGQIALYSGSATLISFPLAMVPWDVSAIMLAPIVFLFIFLASLIVWFTMVFFCFVRYSLAQLLGVILVSGTLVSVAIRLGNEWAALPLILLLIEFLIVFNFISKQAPQSDAS